MFERIILLKASNEITASNKKKWEQNVSWLIIIYSVKVF